MSQTAKIIIAIVVVLAVAAAAHYWYRTSGSDGMGSDSTSLPSGSDNSDTALDQDLTSINGQLQASNGDSAEIDQSVNAAASN